MTDASTRREGIGIVGLGAAACVACCAGPVLAFLGGLTVAGVAGALVIGVAGLALAALAAGAWLVVKRRGRNRCAAAPTSEPTAVGTPRAKVPR